MPTSIATDRVSLAAVPRSVAGGRLWLRGLAHMAIVLAWAAGVSVAAQVRVPVPGTDVPMTLQPLLVLLAGFLLTPGRAVAVMLLYLGFGAAGLPVFAPHSAGLFGPTGGYLVGFAAAAGLVSLLTRAPAPGFGRLVAAGLAGMAVVFAVGVVWRLPFVGGSLPLALQTGVVPFAAKAGVEVLLAAAIVRTTRSLTLSGARPTRRWGQ